MSEKYVGNVEKKAVRKICSNLSGVGVHTIGIHTIGVHTIGVHTIGIHTIGIHTIGTKDNSDT